MTVSARQGTSRDRFDHFCLDNASWLDNYSFFVALKKRFDGRPWSEWPEELRDRVPESHGSGSKRVLGGH